MDIGACALYQDGITSPTAWPGGGESAGHSVHGQECNPLKTELLVDLIQPEDGAARIPQGPGLGIELNEEVVERYRWTGA